MLILKFACMLNHLKTEVQSKCNHSVPPSQKADCAVIRETNWLMLFREIFLLF
jgi:hypothetical protein